MSEHNLSSAEIDSQRAQRSSAHAPANISASEQFRMIQTACLRAAGHPCPENESNRPSFDGVKLSGVKIRITSTGKVVVVPWDTAVQRILGGHAVLVTE